MKLLKTLLREVLSIINTINKYFSCHCEFSTRDNKSLGYLTSINVHQSLPGVNVLAINCF